MSASIAWQLCILTSITYLSHPSHITHIHHISLTSITYHSHPSHITPIYHISLTSITYHSHPSHITRIHHISLTSITESQKPAERPTLFIITILSNIIIRRILRLWRKILMHLSLCFFYLGPRYVCMYAYCACNAPICHANGDGKNFICLYRRCGGFTMLKTW